MGNLDILDLFLSYFLHWVVENRRGRNTVFGCIESFFRHFLDVWPEIFVSCENLTKNRPYFPKTPIFKGIFRKKRFFFDPWGSVATRGGPETSGRLTRTG